MQEGGELCTGRAVGFGGQEVGPCLERMAQTVRGLEWLHGAVGVPAQCSGGWDCPATGVAAGNPCNRTQRAKVNCSLDILLHNLNSIYMYVSVSKYTLLLCIHDNAERLHA